MSLLATALTTTLLFGGDSGQWVVEAQSFGVDVQWVSPTTVTTNATFYENYYNVTLIEAWVSYLGFDFGPFDVTDMLDDTDYNTLGFGPTPLSFPDREFLFPDPPADLAMAFDFLTAVSDEGNLVVTVENVEMGTHEYDLGWPFGTVTVNMEGIGLAADITLTGSDDLCIGDTNGDGVVDTNDILIVIAAWGECPDTDEPDEPCPGDCNLDWYVNVSDLLWVIAQFGDCP
ncbi:MAG: dockerin type I domain-containing protein [Phycisphaerales bacterium]|nr:dockerin type I domain-containing protein [Phycisphaerales bacterium]